MKQGPDIHRDLTAMQEVKVQGVKSVNNTNQQCLYLANTVVTVWAKSLDITHV